MSDIKNLKKVEDIGWEFFKRTGDINAYGMAVSAREIAMKKRLEQEQENNGYGM